MVKAKTSVIWDSQAVSVHKRLTEPETAKEYHKISFMVRSRIPFQRFIEKAYSDPIPIARLLNNYFVQNATESELPEGFALLPRRYFVCSRLSEGPAKV